MTSSYAYIYRALGISDEDLIATIRPPATEAHYHNPESELLFEAAIDFLGKQENTRMVILPRNEKKQTAWVESSWSELGPLLPAVRRKNSLLKKDVTRFDTLFARQYYDVQMSGYIPG